MDGEDLDSDEILKISVDFLKYKSTEVLERLKELIPKNISDNQGRTLLHHACDQKQLNKVKFLIEFSLCSCDIKDNKGYTAFELACKKKHSKITTYLFEIGCQCSVKEGASLNPEVDTEKEGRIINCIYADNREELMRNFSYVTNKNGFFTIMSFYEWTILGVAGYFLAPKCLEFLLYNGCSPDACDGDGLNFIDNLLNAFIELIPPENEYEYINYSSGMECLLIVISYVKNLKKYRNRLSIIFERSKHVGKGSSSPNGVYEENITKKNLGFRLMLERYLESLGG